MIDLHVHLLPGIDDGPADQADAVAMCRAAAADGVEIAVATPHQRSAMWPNARGADIERRHAELAADVSGVLDVRLGAEIRIDSELVAEVEQIPGSGLLPLAGSRYLLLEPHPMPVGPDLRDLVNELVVAGWRPVIAHPERVAWVAETPGLLADLVRLGAALQVTAMSITGDLGRPNRACCSRLLDADLVHFVGSDGHDLRDRTPRLSIAYDAVRARWGADTADRLFVTNPTAVLDDRPLS